MIAGKDKILYIDDDPDDLFIFSETLETQFPEYAILQAQTGEEGLKKMDEENGNLCLVILDMNMPKVDGRQILRSIRENPRWASIPVVVFTTSASNADIAFVSDMGADFVTKPMTYDSLKDTVKTLVSYCWRNDHK